MMTADYQWFCFVFPYYTALRRHNKKCKHQTGLQMFISTHTRTQTYRFPTHQRFRKSLLGRTFPRRTSSATPELFATVSGESKQSESRVQMLHLEICLERQHCPPWSSRCQGDPRSWTRRSWCTLGRSEWFCGWEGCSGESSQIWSFSFCQKWINKS